MGKEQRIPVQINSNMRCIEMKILDKKEAVYDDKQ